MSYEPPDSLSPSRLGTFLTCPLKFRFESLDRFPTTAGWQAQAGTAVHRALELLMADPPEERTQGRLEAHLATAMLDVDAALTEDEMRSLRKTAAKSLAKYAEMEDPTQVRPEGLELRLEVDVDGLILRGIIDRLDLSEDGSVVIDYKTGKMPGEKYEAKALIGMHCYSLMHEIHFGVIPARLVLMYVAHGQSITKVPTERTNKAIRQKINAVRSAIERACEHDDFRASPSGLCNNYCDFQAFCPAFDGRPEEAFVQLTPRPVSS